MNKLLETLNQAGVPTQTLQRVCNQRAETFFSLKVPGGAEAIQFWSRIRACVPQTGFYPVLIGDNEDRDRLQESMEFDNADFPALLNRCEELSANNFPNSWIRDRLIELAEDREVPENQVFPSGLWPENVAKTDFTIPFTYTGKPLAEVNLLFVPTKVCWHVPLLLRYGAWNDCPGAEEHGAWMKYWQETFDAEVVGITGDVVNMRVGQPPRGRSAALELARQQFLYCTDIVEQGVETIEALAASLLNHSAWFFWWD